MIKEIKYHLVIFLCFPLFSLFAVDSLNMVKSFSGICTRVYDGDTIIVRNKKIRLQFIDAPELGQKSTDGVAIGLNSKNYLEREVLNQKVVIKYKELGKYGRYIGQVYKKALNVNKKMIREGQAILYSNMAPKSWFYLEFDARIKRKGIYKTEGFFSPKSYRRKARN